MRAVRGLRLWPAAFLAIVFGSLSAAPSSQRVELRFRGTPGDQSRYAVQIHFSPLANATGKLADMANAFPFNRLFQFTIRQAVTDVDAEDQLHVAYTLDSVSLSGSADDSKVPFIEEALASVSGKALTFVMAPSGAVTNVEGLEGVRDTNLQETLKSVLARLHPRFPLVPMVPGRSWKYAESFESRFNTVVGALTVRNSSETRYTLVGFEEKHGHRCAKIRAEMTVTQTIPTDKLPIELPFAVTAEGSGKGTGLIYFAIDAGKLVSGDFSVLQQGNVTLRPKGRDPGKPGEFQKMLGAELTTTIKMELLPAK